MLCYFARKCNFQQAFGYSAVPFVKDCGSMTTCLLLHLLVNTSLEMAVMWPAHDLPKADVSGQSWRWVAWKRESLKSKLKELLVKSLLLLTASGKVQTEASAAHLSG